MAQVEIVQVKPPVAIARGRGKWRELEVVYKDNGKVEGRKFVDFEYKDVFDVLTNAKEGEVYDISREKVLGKDNVERWKWTGIVNVGSAGAAAGGTVGESSENSTANAGAVQPTDRQRAADKQSGRSVGGIVPEALRQRLIVRQSSISAAVILANAQGDSSLANVLELAKAFEQHVFNENAHPASKIDDDIPW